MAKEPGRGYLHRGSERFEQRGRGIELFRFNLIQYMRQKSRFGCQVVDRLASSDTPSLNLLSECHGAIILSWDSLRNRDSIGRYVNYINIQRLMSNYPHWKMSSEIEYTAVPSLFAIQ